MGWLLKTVERLHKGGGSSAAKDKALFALEQPAHVNQRRSRPTVGNIHPIFMIPEILENILWCLTLEDLKVARLVSRHWCTTSRSMICLRATWFADSFHHDQQFILQALPNLDSLCFSLENKRRGNYKVLVAWEALRDQIQRGDAAHMRGLNARGRIDRAVHIEHWITPLLPYMNGLTSLQLTDADPSTYTIAAILNVCPQLLTLDIKFGSLSSKKEPQVLEAGLRELRGPYNLTFLRLFHLYCDQRSIEAVVARCPLLQTLVLFYLSERPQQPHPGNNDTDVDAAASESTLAREDHGRLLLHIAKYCPQLVTLQVSAFEEEESMINPLSQFSNLRALGIPAGVLTSQLVSIIHAYPNTLTSLRIESGGAAVDVNNRELSRSLHHYLCTAPQLLELTLPYLPFDYRLLDLSYDAPLITGEIWACRELVSLSIRFDDKFLPAEHASRTTAKARWRKLYGYMAMVCPQLQHLTIARGMIECGLESGLCLLSALGRLQTLDLCASSIHHLRELDWINRYATRGDHSRPSSLISQTSKLELPDVLRARYEWFGYKDCRTIDRAKLAELGLEYSSVPEPPSVSSQIKDEATIHSGHPPTFCLGFHGWVPTSRGSGGQRGRHGHVIGRLKNKDDSGTYALPQVVWPRLTHFSVYQTSRVLPSASSIRAHIKSLRPELDTNQYNQYHTELSLVNHGKLAVSQ
ncbi:hypothetical protein BGZ70_001998 [Mortierella alpina]|uniref:F-box domain-containing protein n=1 Tax=Mortierella alpina TaxID=64518 RepID=A0A9P6M5N9_MORAP|nr:hypothetical protein BGZ70_001998 [Mortierella alpina]